MRWCEMHPRIIHGVDGDCPDAASNHISAEFHPMDVETMCGRYDNLIAREAHRRLFKVERLPPSNFPPRYNVAPTDQIPIVRIDPQSAHARIGLGPGASCRSG